MVSEQQLKAVDELKAAVNKFLSLPEESAESVLEHKVSEEDQKEVQKLRMALAEAVSVMNILSTEPEPEPAPEVAPEPDPVKERFASRKDVVNNVIKLASA